MKPSYWSPKLLRSLVRCFREQELVWQLLDRTQELSCQVFTRRRAWALAAPIVLSQLASYWYCWYYYFLLNFGLKLFLASVHLTAVTTFSLDYPYFGQNRSVYSQRLALLFFWLVFFILHLYHLYLQLPQRSRLAVLGVLSSFFS